MCEEEKCECKWHHKDCKNNPNKCYMCSTEDYYYVSSFKKPKQFKNKNVKKSKRMGSQFEYNNHIQNQQILTNSFLTPNSGAGKIKGDEEIKGLINISEELKTCETRNEGRKPGTESFTIKKSWLDKLAKESKKAGREFWYLKFAFKNSDKVSYVVIDTDMIMSMIATMVNDRRNAKIVESKKEIYEKQRRLDETKIVELTAENELLKEKIKYLELQLKTDTL